MPPVNKIDLFKTLPPERPLILKPAPSDRSIVVFDDDPTGTQTVYDLPVLTDWSADGLLRELRAGTPAFYVLTNSRSLPGPEARALTLDAALRLKLAALAAGRKISVISRSDSTLRGHYPAETDALNEALGPHDGVLIAPFFLEGGRFTVDDVHYVAEGDALVPAAETPFARDAAFGYHHSNLREWVEEKTRGRVRAGDVASISLSDSRAGGAARVAEKLATLSGGRVCIVNAASLSDMAIVTDGLAQAEARGKRLLCRSAASFVQARLGLPTRPLLDARALGLKRDSGGLIIVGSYVPKTTVQLNALLASGIAAVEIDVAQLLNDEQHAMEVARARNAVEAHLRAGADVVVYTSRELVSGVDARDSLAIGARVSSGLVALLGELRVRPRYVIAKGGITSSDLATKALEMRRAWVLGQLLPGVPVWRGEKESRYPGMPYVVFPGNVGGESALVDAVNVLA